jgi:hypothetical protein
VRVHDFLINDLGRAVPYGVYDLAANAAWVSVGIEHDTAGFAVQTIRRRWHEIGRSRYTAATRLLITADGGGSNGSRLRLWKRELQRPADELGIDAVIHHLPPGTSKWNKPEAADLRAVRRARTMRWPSDWPLGRSFRRGCGSGPRRPPATDNPFVGALGIFQAFALCRSGFRAIVACGDARSSPLARHSSTKLDRSALPSNKTGTCEHIVLLAIEDMPNDRGQLPCGRHGCDLASST